LDNFSIPLINFKILHDLNFKCNYFSLAEVGPKKILDLMSVPGLTRENVASHLQVCRYHVQTVIFLCSLSLKTGFYADF
jgi:hypothetical protein